MFRPCSQVMASGVGQSTEAESVPVCSSREYFHSVAFAGKWQQDLRGHYKLTVYELRTHLQWPMNMVEITHYGNFDVSTMFTGRGKSCRTEY